jgi:hypothetical protein
VVSRFRRPSRRPPAPPKRGAAPAAPRRPRSSRVVPPATIATTGIARDHMAICLRSTGAKRDRSCYRGATEPPCNRRTQRYHLLTHVRRFLAGMGRPGAARVLEISGPLPARLSGSRGIALQFEIVSVGGEWRRMGLTGNGPGRKWGPGSRSPYLIRAKSPPTALRLPPRASGLERSRAPRVDGWARSEMKGLHLFALRLSIRVVPYAFGARVHSM